MNIVRRALATVVVGGTTLGGLAVFGTAAAQAVTRVPTSLSITAPHQITYGQSATVGGTLTNTVTHHPLAGQPVTLETRNPGTIKWTVVKTSATAANGTVSFSLPLTGAAQVLLVHPATANTAKTNSSVSQINVAYAVTASVNVNKVVSVSVAPKAAGQTVALQFQKGTKWVTVHVYKLGVASTASFKITPPTKKGTYHYQVVKPASHGYQQGVSAILTVTV